MTQSRTGLFILFVISALICAWDVYAATHGRGNVWVAWVLAIVMGLFALAILRKIVRKDYTNTIW